MTRGDIKAACRTSIMQGSNSPLREYAGPIVDGVLDGAADYICQCTDALFDEQITDLQAGVSTYCVPKVYKTKEFYTLDPSGNMIRMDKQNTREADSRLWGWRQWPAQAFPRHVIVDGSTTLTVAPAPLADIPGGLIVVGFCVSTLPAAGHVTHQWDTDADECPLPSWAHQAVLNEFIYRRLRQLSSREPGLKELRDMWRDDARREMANVATNALNAYRSQIRPRLAGGGWYGGTGGV